VQVPEFAGVQRDFEAPPGVGPAALGRRVSSRRAAVGIAGALASSGSLGFVVEGSIDFPRRLGAEGSEAVLPVSVFAGFSHSNAPAARFGVQTTLALASAGVSHSGRVRYAVDSEGAFRLVVSGLQGSAIDALLASGRADRVLELLLEWSVNLIDPETHALYELALEPRVVIDRFELVTSSAALAPVPEPSTALLTFVGLLLLARRARRVG
jgi:hypothetical protein